MAVSSKIKLAFRLGLLSIFHLKFYRLKCGVGFFIKKLPIVRAGEPFCVLQGDKSKSESFNAVDNELTITYFFNDVFRVDCSGQFDPYNNCHRKIDKHWSKITERDIFNKPNVDIKSIWEFSRFYFLVGWAKECRNSRGESSISRLQNFLITWLEKNPYNQGINWLCAQEVSIRIVNVLLSLHIMSAKNFSSSFIIFVKRHSERIEPAMSYAKAQKNNHSMSEAIGLYYTGLWLANNADCFEYSTHLTNLGKRCLEKELVRLVLPDGTFSQYSLTYHAIVVDIIVMALWLTQKYKQAPFSESFMQKARLVLGWLATMVDPECGDAPNLGSNDTTALFKIDSGDYRDYRGRLQSLSVLLLQQRCYGNGHWNEALKLLGVDFNEFPIVPLKQKSQEFESGGIVKIYSDNSWALVRYPRFKFRPSQADCLHFDLWVSGVNVLRDNGTYSYNAEPKIRDYFRGIESHNSVQFDGKQPMPMVSRFLFSDWVNTTVTKPLSEKDGRFEWSGYYKDTNCCFHKRTVIYDNNEYIIRDEIRNYSKKAIIRWHLADLQWRLDGKILCSDMVTIESAINGVVCMPNLVESDQSLYYMSKTKKPAIYLEIDPPSAIVETTISILV